MWAGLEVRVGSEGPLREQGPSLLPALVSPGRPGCRSGRGNAGNPFLGLIVPGRVREAALGTCIPAPLASSAHPGSPLTPTGSPSAARRFSHPEPPKRPHLPEPAAGVPPTREQLHPRPSSSSTPPFLLLLLPAAPGVGSPAVCASVSGPFPAPRPGPGPGPRFPRRRTCPLPGRLRARDRDPAERSGCASAAPRVGAPSGSELCTELSCPAPLHPPG